MDTNNITSDPNVQSVKRVDVDILLRKMSDQQKKENRKKTIIISTVVASVGALFFLV